MPGCTPKPDMEYIKTECTCCGNVLQMGDNACVFINNWANMDFALMFQSDRSPAYGGNNEEIEIWERYNRITLAFMMFKAEISWRTYKLALGGHGGWGSGDDKEYHLGRNCWALVIPSALWQKDPDFGGCGIDLSLHFRGFSTIVNEDGGSAVATVATGTVALPFMGSVTVYKTWNKDKK